MTANTEYLCIINTATYRNERPYNAFRLALNLVKREGTHIRVFLMAIAAIGALTFLSGIIIATVMRETL